MGINVAAAVLGYGEYDSSGNGVRDAGLIK